MRVEDDYTCNFASCLFRLRITFYIQSEDDKWTTYTRVGLYPKEINHLRHIHLHMSPGQTLQTLSKRSTALFTLLEGTFKSHYSSANKTQKRFDSHVSTDVHLPSSPYSRSPPRQPRHHDVRTAATERDAPSASADATARAAASLVAVRIRGNPRRAVRAGVQDPGRGHAGRVLPAVLPGRVAGEPRAVRRGNGRGGGRAGA